MQLTINKKDFVRGLGLTHSVADRKASMTMLSNVLLSTDGSKALRLAATDLYLAVSASCAAVVDQPGSVACSARTLFDIVKNLPEGDVSLQVGENRSCEIRCGKGSRYRIPGMPGEEFPALPDPGEGAFAELDQELVARLIGLTHYSMSSDETRPHLAGALFESQGNVVRMVTTDGHRLSKAEHKLEDKLKLDFSMLVPNKGIAELRRLLDDGKSDRGKKPKIGIAAVASNAFFRKDDVLLSVKLADEQFPPYNKVIPQSLDRRVVVARNLLQDALRRISLVASDKSGAVRFSVDPGLLRISTENPDIGEGVEELDVDFAGEAVEIGFNARYLLDVLNALTDNDVALELGGQLDPGVVHPAADSEAFVGVIMPMRI